MFENKSNYSVFAWPWNDNNNVKVRLWVFEFIIEGTFSRFMTNVFNWLKFHYLNLIGFLPIWFYLCHFFYNWLIHIFTWMGDINSQRCRVRRILFQIPRSVIQIKQWLSMKIAWEDIFVCLFLDPIINPRLIFAVYTFQCIHSLWNLMFS